MLGLGLLGKAVKGVAMGDAQAKLGAQSPHLAAGAVRVGRFLYATSGAWVGAVLYSGYANMRTQPGSGPSLVMPGKPIIGPPDRPAKPAGAWFPTATAAAGKVPAGTKSTLVGGAKADYPLQVERTDQGVDFGGAGPIGAIGDGTVTYAGGWPGWPGKDGIVYHTAYGNIYIMEGVRRAKNPATGRPFAKGDTVKSGQVIAHAFAGPHGIETGYANAQSTGPLTPYNGKADGTAMPGGLLFRKLLGYT